MGRKAGSARAAPRLAPDEPVVGRTAEFIGRELSLAAGSNAAPDEAPGDAPPWSTTRPEARASTRASGALVFDPLSKAPS